MKHWAGCIPKLERRFITKGKRMSRRSKYNARPVTIKGITFDSQKEADRYLVLLSRHQEGEITMLEVHPRFELQPAFTHKGKKYRAINYEADFEYIDNDYNHVVEDVKGVETPVFKLKMKMFLRQYPHIDFRIVR